MADQLNEGAPQVRSRVNIDAEGELQWWALKFGTSAEQIRRAVTKVGNSVPAVAKELGTPLPANLWQPRQD